MTAMPPPPAPILVIMGVTGCGKSTVAEILHERLGWDLAEGDAFHPRANVEKMAAGTPLTDDDRWPWLDVIADWIEAHEAAGTPALVTSSALKRSYRDVLRRPHVVFVHLAGSKETIAARLARRADHFMPPSLLDSQFAILETPGDDERHVTIDLHATPAQEAGAIMEWLGIEEDACASE